MTLNLNTVSAYGILDTDLHVTFEVYDCITKLHRQQAEFVKNNENENVYRIGQDEVKHRIYEASCLRW